MMKCLKAISLLTLFVNSILFAVNPITEANYLIITHPELSQGTWLGDLVNLQTNRGFDIGVLLVQDQVTTNSDIQDSIALAYSTGVPVNYVLLVGAAAHQEPEIPPDRKQENRDLRLDTVDASQFNFIPFTYENMEIWYNDVIDVPTDDHYVSNLEGNGEISIGRVPAKDKVEVSLWLSKLTEYYYSYDVYSTWKNKEVMVSQNVTNPWNHVPGHKVNWMYDDVIPYINNYVEVSFLRATDIDSANAWGTNNGVYPLIEPFEAAVNEGPALMHFFGTGADADNIGNFYFFHESNACEFQFTNDGKYPFFMGSSCTLGGIQYPTTNPCVLQKMMFLDRAGLIGFYGSTIITTQWACREFSEDLHRLLFQDKVNEIGKLSKDTKSSFEPRMPTQVWHSRGFVLYGDPSMPLALFKHKDYDITSSTTWQGNIVIEQPITLTGGNTLTIKPGTGIFLKEGVELFIEPGAILNAMGTETYPIVFAPAIEGNYNPGFWKGITGEESEINLDYCNIFGATNGLYTKKGRGKITNCIFENNVTGIGINYSDDFVINNNSIGDNDTGILLSFSSPLISGNKITYNLNYGLYAYRSYSELKANEISDNSIFGIKISNRSDIVLASSIYEGESPQVNNKFEYNLNSSIWIERECFPNIGQYMESQNILYGGFNQFNNGDGRYIDIINESEKIYAQVNWWELEPLFKGNEIYYRPTAEELVGPPGKTLASVSYGMSPELAVAYNLELTEDYSGAAIAFENIIYSSPRDSIALISLAGLVRCYYAISDISGLKQKLTDLYTLYQNFPVGIAAYDYSVTAHTKVGDYSEALNRSVVLESIFSGTNREAAVLFEQGMIYQMMSVSGDSVLNKSIASPALKQLAIERFEKVLNDYPNTSSAELAAWLLGRKHVSSYELPHKLPEKYVLNSNYPNPFNPITAIIYELPERSYVELSIYDLLGREITQLVNRHVNGGIHRVLWDGKDHTGQPVASGMYIYKISAVSTESTESYTANRKMVLLR